MSIFLENNFPLRYNPDLKTLLLLREEGYSMARQQRQGQQRGVRQRGTPVFDLAKLAERLYQLRHRHHWTQQVLGTQSGVHYVTISKLEKQALPGVSADTVTRLAKTFGVSVDYLLGMTDEDDEPARTPAYATSG
jgi:DNA-binding XRE family transcriptional regulator